MAKAITHGSRIAAIGTCVPVKIYDNIADTKQFKKNEVRKVTAMAGVSQRRIADESICSSDLCVAAAENILDTLGWTRDTIDALIMVTQSPDYLLPSTACVAQERLGLTDECAAFDVGLGCSGYPYGLWIASMMLQKGGLERVLLLHGETPTRFSDASDRSVSLLFGDSGSATAIEAKEEHKAKKWYFKLHSDGSGYQDMIIPAGGFRNRMSEDPSQHCVHMNGANIFNFTIKRVPQLIHDTFALSNRTVEDIDYFIFHQSNRFIINHLIKKCKLQAAKVPIILKKYGNTGGASIPLAITQGNLDFDQKPSLQILLLGYGVGFSWGSALVDLSSDTLLAHVEI